MLVSNNRDFLNWVTITTSQRQWLHDDLCGITLAAVHRLGGARRWRNGDGWDGPCWRLWSDVVNLLHLSNSEDVFLGKNGKNLVFVWSWQKDAKGTNQPRSPSGNASRWASRQAQGNLSQCAARSCNTNVQVDVSEMEKIWYKQQCSDMMLYDMM